MLEAIKLAALDVLDKESLSDFCYGIVTETNPLKIMLEQKLELSAPFLILSRSVTDYEISGVIDIEGDVRRNYKASVKNHLLSGDNVILLKATGGQQYVVVDRFGEAKEGR